VSLLRSQGHQQALNYPLGAVVDEARMIVERIDNQIATEAILNRQAIHSLFSPKANKAFEKDIKRLIDNGKA